MNKKFSSKIITLTITMIAILANQFVAVNTSAQAAAAPAIQDSLLLEGFNALNNLKDPIRLGNGQTISGEKLAQFLVDQQIPVVWGSDEICKGSSCSRMYCSVDGKCSYEDGKPGIDPIYLNAAIQTQASGRKTRLVRDLAHEIFHRMRPLGEVKISQIEEYWAFYVEAQITRSSWPKFDNVDPEDPAQLEKWFSLHALNGYLKLAPYPDGFVRTAKTTQVFPTLASK